MITKVSRHIYNRQSDYNDGNDVRGPVTMIFCTIIVFFPLKVKSDERTKCIETVIPMHSFLEFPFFSLLFFQIGLDVVITEKGRDDRVTRYMPKNTTGLTGDTYLQFRFLSGVNSNVIFTIILTTVARRLRASKRNAKALVQLLLQ